GAAKLRETAIAMTLHSRMSLLFTIFSRAIHAIFFVRTARSIKYSSRALSASAHSINSRIFAEYPIVTMARRRVSGPVPAEEHGHNSARSSLCLARVPKEPWVRAGCDFFHRDRDGNQRRNFQRDQCAVADASSLSGPEPAGDSVEPLAWAEHHRRLVFHRAVF